MRARAVKAGLTGILFFLAAAALFADKAPVTLAAAEALEKDGKPDQAMAVYEEWLKDNGNDPQFVDVLQRCGNLKKSPWAAIDLYRNYLDAVKDATPHRTLCRSIAQLYTLLGAYRAALSFFERAFETPDDAAGRDPWLAAVPSLYVACGETDKAYAWVVRVDPVVREPGLRAELNYALLEIYLARRDIPNAEKALSILAGEFKATVAYPKALFRFIVYYFAAGDKDKAAVYREVLRRDFPASLEAAAAAALWSSPTPFKLSLLSDPHEILGGEPFDDGAVKKADAVEKADLTQPSSPPVKNDTPKTDAQGDTAASPKTDTAGRGLRIQVGSYTMRENADYAVRDLKKLSFQAEVVETVIQGKTYFRVFVGKALSAEQAQTILARLQDAGIGGYLFAGEN